MKLTVIQGKNCKTYIRINDLKTKKDFELYDAIKTCLERTEYMPFLRGFDKNQYCTYLFNEYIFPVQFLKDVEKILDQLSDEPIEIENSDLIYQDIIRDDFDTLVKNYKFPDEIKTDDPIYFYQQDAVFYGIKNRISKIDVATAGGKTFITYLYCRVLFDLGLNENKKFLIVVPSQTLAKQLKKEFSEYDKFFDRHLITETIFAGSKRIYDADIVCGTYQSLSQYDEDYFDDFGVFICDELHRAKAYSIRNEIYCKLLNCKFYFGMTGTMPKYKTLDYLHIVSMFGSTVVTRTQKDNIDAGVSTPVQISIVKINYSESEYADFSINLKLVGIVGIEKYAAEKQFFQTNERRTSIIGKLLNAFHGNSLILVDTVEYCTILQDFLSRYCPDWTFEIIHGTIKNRDEIFDEMRNSKDKYCIIGTYGTMGTGINIKNLEICYFADGGKSESRIGQAIGRIMRLFNGKILSRIIDIYDDLQDCAFKNQARARIRYYEEKQFPYKITKTKI